jgi:hypothetical protein
LLFRNVDAPHQRPARPFVPKIVDDLVDFRHGHGVYRFRCGAWRQCALVGVQLGVGPQVQVWVVELSVDVLEWQFALAALLDDIQHRLRLSSSLGSPFVSLLGFINHRL